MTDTIDVAALVERLTAADRPHLSDLAISLHEHLCREAATALQSQADALAEARRNSDIAFRAAIDSGEDLENAQEELSTMREALEIAQPYVKQAVNDDGGIDNCDIGDRLALEKIDRALGGSNAE